MTEPSLPPHTDVTTPHIADGCLAVGVPVRCAPAGVRPLRPGMRCAGPVQPVRHVGSIDVFLEAANLAEPGAVLVVDNDGRLDEACIGDIVMLEAHTAGIAGLVLWGLHRDAPELAAIGHPLFSLGAFPSGPRRLESRPADAFARAVIGAHVVDAHDWVFADDNGVLFVPRARLAEVLDAARRCRDVEARQLDAMRAGLAYREQIAFADFLARRAREPGYDLRRHLKALAAAGEA